MGNQVNPKITVLIEVYNEENNIQDCIEGAHLLSNNILVIDMQSTDKTAVMAKKNGAVVYEFPHAKYVEPAREFGIEKVKGDWVFLLDADERITKELASEIKEIVKAGRGTHYKIPRKNIFGKKWLRHGGWWPDYQLRLIHKPSFESWSEEIHSTPQIKGNKGYLKNPFLHFFHGDFEQMVNKTIIYEEIESGLLYKADKTVKTSTFFRKFLGEIYRRIIRGLGFMDGSIGIIEGIYQAFSKTVTYLYLYEKQKSRSL